MIVSSYKCMAVINTLVLTLVNSYEVPEPKILVYEKGFSVSIPDTDGIQLFAFHGNINKNMYGLDAGQFSKDITKRQGNEWVFEEFNTRLRPGDVIYFWLYVQRRGLGFRYDNGEFIVEDIPSRPYVVSKPKIENSIGGFKVTIPPREGIELSAYQGEINSVVDKTAAINHDGRTGNDSAFENRDDVFRRGDVIHYWLFVARDSLGYRYDNEKFVARATKPNSTSIKVRWSKPDSSVEKSANTFHAANNEEDDELETPRSTTTESLEILKKLNRIWIR